MTMTRQHFQLIADVVRTTSLAPKDRAELARVFANKLAETNPAFNRERFFRAALTDANNREN